MKMTLRLLAAAGTFALLAFAFGYFDAELDDLRRLGGCSLIVVGMSLAWPALVRLAEDWPRLKPQHNVDLAFVQIGLSIAVLIIACMMGGRFAARFAPLVDPMPKLTQPVSRLRTPPQESAKHSLTA